jgi:hypothetical protein
MKGADKLIRRQVIPRALTFGNCVAAAVHGLSAIAHNRPVPMRFAGRHGMNLQDCKLFGRIFRIPT